MPKTTPTQNQPAAQPTNQYIIKKCTTFVTLFPPDEPVNRRMNPREFKEELEEAKLWGRQPRTFIRDKPFYNLCPEVPFYTVNFDLNAPK